jgi:aminoglycoside phosphotransferase (APT) family kinase protein
MLFDELVKPSVLGRLLVDATGIEEWREFEVTLIAGGKSNLTFELTSAAGSLILRRPPTGVLLPSAHDMIREVRVQKALSQTSVPVPKVTLLVAGDDSLGVPFYIMEKVDGLVIRDVIPPGYANTTVEKQGLADALIDTLVELHQIDPAEVGLTDFGRPAGFVARQLQRWNQQWERVKTADVNELDELTLQLSKRIPPAHHVSILHGDYRIDNCIFSLTDSSHLMAILDWEMSALGDSMVDLAMTRLYWRGPHDRKLALVPNVTSESGFPNRDLLTERYAKKMNSDLDDLAFYDAFACFKFAIITQGVLVRAAHGDMAGQRFGEAKGEVRELASEGLAQL